MVKTLTENHPSAVETIAFSSLRARILAGAFAIFLGLALLPFSDAIWPISFNVVRSLTFLHDFFNITQFFASSTVLILTVLIIWIFDSRKRRLLPLFLIAYLLGSLATFTTKEFFGRARPDYSVALRSKGKEWIEKYRKQHPQTPIEPDGSVRWLLLKGGRPYFQANYASFPSGHAAAAFAFAAFLCMLYPRVSSVWILLAAGCSLGRIFFKHHFLEDILVGAGIGWVIANWVYSRAVLLRAVDKLPQLPILGGLFRDPCPN